MTGRAMRCFMMSCKSCMQHLQLASSRGCPLLAGDSPHRSGCHRCPCRRRRLDGEEAGSRPAARAPPSREMAAVDSRPRRPRPSPAAPAAAAAAITAAVAASPAGTRRRWRRPRPATPCCCPPALLPPPPGPPPEPAPSLAGCAEPDRARHRPSRLRHGPRLPTSSSADARR
jgi:hypothetical protein